MERLNRGRSGNPNMKLQHPGYSINPDGRPKDTPGFRARMRDWMTEKGERILRAMAEQEENHEDRRFALQMIVQYAHHKPLQPAAVAFQDMTPRVIVVPATAPKVIEHGRVRNNRTTPQVDD
jgi:hypothetical protein